MQTTVIMQETKQILSADMYRMHCSHGQGVAEHRTIELYLVKNSFTLKWQFYPERHSMYFKFLW